MESTPVVVDNGATQTNFTFTLDTSKQQVGPNGTLVCGIDREQLLQGVGCKTADLCQFNNIIAHPIELSEPTNATYGITFGHSSVKNKPDAIETPNRSVQYDHSTGVASCFHTVHTTGAAFGSMKLPIKDKVHEDSQMPYKIALRWKNGQSTDGPFSLMTDKNVNYGVTKTTHESGEDKYLITPGDANGESAMWRLLENNKNAAFCGGRYKDGVRKEVNYNGQTAIVMSSSDFSTLSSQLKKTLGTSSKFNNGFYAHCMLTSGTPPKSITIPLTFCRDPELLEGHDSPVVTMADLSEKLAQSGVSKAVKTPLTKSVFPNAPEGTTATFTPLTTIDEVKE